jgi:hypothetical protein
MKLRRRSDVWSEDEKSALDSGAKRRHRAPKPGLGWGLIKD